LTGLISGILGGGGLFGIDRLATGGGNARRSALGLGVTPGEQRAFDLNYGRLPGSENILSGVNEALHDPRKIGALYNVGLSQRDIQGKDAAEVATSFIAKLKDLVDQTPENQLGVLIEQRHLEGIADLATLQGLKGTPRSEIDEYAKHNLEDIDRFNLSGDEQRKLQNLSVELDRSGGKIRTGFERMLARISDPLSHFSQVVSDRITDLMKNPHLGEYIDQLAKKIDGWAKYLGGEAFTKDLGTFEDNVAKAWGKLEEFATKVENIVGDLDEAIKHVKAWFTGESPGVNGPLSDENPNAPGSPAFYAAHPEIKQPDWNPVPAPDSGDRWDYLKPWKWHFAPAGAVPSPRPEEKTAFDRLESQNQLPSGLLNAVYQTESGGGKHLVSPAGAQGPFQFIPETAKTYGVANPFDFNQSSEGASRYLRKLLDEFHGDVGKAAAAYNWGESHVEDAVAKAMKEHTDWHDYLPRETADYVNKITNNVNYSTQRTALNQPRPMTVNVNVISQPGGNTIGSASQLVAAGANTSN
jgi:hypothetical protein